MYGELIETRDEDDDFSPDLSIRRSEADWITQLKALLQNSPQRLWLFVDDAVHVMKVDASGERAMIGDDTYDPQYEVDRIDDVECAGGEW